MERESVDFDVLIVGAGPAGLSAACRLMQCAKKAQRELSVCVVEKGSEIGAHIISGAIFDPKALNELFPDWKKQKAPLNTVVQKDETYYLRNETKSIRLPHFFIPPTMHNQNYYIVSLGNVCRWLAQQAEQLGVEIFSGFSAKAPLIENDTVMGIVTGDMGRDAHGNKKNTFMLGMEIRAKYTLFAEGSKGHIGKQLIDHFNLDQGRDPQHYAIGFKEIWQIKSPQSCPGYVLHTAGWPLSETQTTGGGFLYHMEGNEIMVGLVVDLNYHNPFLDPFQEFQRFKSHPILRAFLQQGQRIAYGARAITKGGVQSMPKATFPGGLLIGCNAGTLNNAKIKGSHTAMKSGLLAAEVIFDQLSNEPHNKEPMQYNRTFKQSWAYQEVYEHRNFAPLIHRYGTCLGGGIAWLNMRFQNKLIPWTLHDQIADHATLVPIQKAKKITYNKPDGLFTFDRMSSVFLSNTHHEEDQPCHLILENKERPLQENLPQYAEPAQRYCPAGVYEITSHNGKQRFVIHAQNCIHCKTCDIKDPAQNITWQPPEGGGGPNYPNM